MRSSSPRAALAGLVLSAALGLGAAACTKEAAPAPPGGGASPSTGPNTTGANTVPPGASGQGSQGGQGVDPASP